LILIKNDAIVANASAVLRMFVSPFFQAIENIIKILSIN